MYINIAMKWNTHKEIIRRSCFVDLIHRSNVDAFTNSWNLISSIIFLYGDDWEIQFNEEPISRITILRDGWIWQFGVGYSLCCKNPRQGWELNHIRVHQVERKEKVSSGQCCVSTKFDLQTSSYLTVRSCYSIYNRTWSTINNSVQHLTFN